MSRTSDFSGMAKGYSYNALHRLEDDSKLPVNSNNEAVRYEIEVSYMRGVDSDSWIWHSQADHHRLYKWIYIVDLLSR